MRNALYLMYALEQRIASCYIQIHLDTPRGQTLLRVKINDIDRYSRLLETVPCVVNPLRINTYPKAFLLRDEVAIASLFLHRIPRMPNTKSLALLLLPAVAGLSVQTREAAIAAPTLTFKNNCSTQHTLWFAGVRRVTLPPRAAFSGSFPNNEAGYFYTGNANGLNTIKIGFFEVSMHMHSSRGVLMVKAG